MPNNSNNKFQKPSQSIPLAQRMRPNNLDEFVGQNHAVGKGTLIHQALLRDRVFSMILWGPPGCGKTTLARIIAKETRSYFVFFSATMSGVKEIRQVIDQAKKKLDRNIKTLLFIDEIHRFSKNQQDALLYHVESGLLTFIGATTENPSFEVIPALMSRCRLVVLKSLPLEDISMIIDKALKDKEKGLGQLENLELTKKAMDYLLLLAQGDARVALNNLEAAVAIVTDAKETYGKKDKITLRLGDLEKAFQKKALIYDKSGEEHYNLISALHKSLRGSDPDAALYWLNRMLTAGENPLYIARRMVRFASEDIGNADPYALTVTINAKDAYEFLGSPEGELALAQAALYLATAPKSNSIYTAWNKVSKTIRQSGTLPVPLHIRNAPTKLMKDLDYGKGYKYPHDYEKGVVKQSYMPDKLKGQRFYFPTDRGHEKIISQRLSLWRKKTQN